MNLIYKPVKICNYVSNIEVDNHLISKLQILFFVYIRCVLSKWDYFVKKENLILGLKIKTRTNKEEQKININYLYK